MDMFIPFADDAASISIILLTVENGTDRIALYGSLNLIRDWQGFADARAPTRSSTNHCMCWRQPVLLETLPAATVPKSVRNRSADLLTATATLRYSGTCPRWCRSSQHRSDVINLFS